MKERGLAIKSVESISKDNAYELVADYFRQHTKDLPPSRSEEDIKQALMVLGQDLLTPDTFRAAADWLTWFGQQAPSFPTAELYLEDRLGKYAVMVAAKNLESWKYSKQSVLNMLNLINSIVTKGTNSEKEKGKPILHAHLPWVKTQMDHRQDTFVQQFIPTFFDYLPDDFKTIGNKMDKIFASNSDIRTDIYLYTLFTSPYPDLHELGIRYVKILLAQVPLMYDQQEVHEFMEAWKASNPNNPDYLRYNIGVARSLERMEPGITRTLRRDFGIRCFARYPRYVLLDQYRLRDDTESDYGVVILPYHDHNGAFYYIEEVLDQLYDRLAAKSKRIRIYESKNPFETMKSVIKAYKKYGKIHFAIGAVHGATKEVTYGQYRGENTVSVDDVEAILGNPRMNKYFVPNPFIGIISCLTGRKNGFAQTLSKTGARVSGPTQSTNVKHIDVEEKNDRLTFEISYRRGSTKTYESGNLVEY